MNAPAPERWTVAHFMTPLVCCADLELTLKDAGDRMAANKIRHLVITRASFVVGLLSERDLQLATSLDPKATIMDAMRGEVFAVDANTPIEEVAKVLEARKLGCAVVRKGDRATGIFTTTDAMRAIRSIVSGQLQPALAPPTLIVRDGNSGRHSVRVSETVAASL